MTSSLTPTESPEVRSADPAERLLEQHWDRKGRVGRRELITELIAALFFLAVAVPMAISVGSVDLKAAGLLTVLYLVVSRIEFPIGAGYFVPSYLALVPMLLVLPPGIVPILVAVALVLGSLVMRTPATRSVLGVADATHAIGPAAVLAIAGSHESWAIYVAAFAAGCLLDMASSVLREAIALGVAPRVQGRVALRIWLIDACLAPVGLLAGLRARDDLGSVLLILPFAALLLMLARERNLRIDQAHQRLDQAETDVLTGLGNRRRLTADLEERLTGDPAVLVLFDLDGFKQYNDTHGHPAGDALLAQLGRRLGDAVDGTTYRLGGDEFCVIADPGDLDALLARTAEALHIDGDVLVTASHGVVQIPAEAATVADALGLADQRMYAGKQRRSPACEQSTDVLLALLNVTRPALRERGVRVAALATKI
ncbi:MAG: hypothetical protein QOF76_4938, partial [Solirubrobacteraceae bacterium]|nr:hypothetical protein [Solirubrobacteraceae bacterium]